MNKKRGFTLIELLIVIAVISILSSIIYINWSNAQKRARDNKRKADLQSVSSALSLYYADKKEYPSRPRSGSAPSGNDRVAFAADGLSILMNQNFIPVIPLDPASKSGAECHYMFLQNNDSEKPQNYKLVSTGAETILGNNSAECEANAGEFADSEKKCKQYQVSSSNSSKNWKISTYNNPSEVSGCK
jgi:prepilin-type N-terminal cleavage/methylation domain-containing protein